MNTRLKILFCPDLGLRRQSGLIHQWIVAFSDNVLRSNFDLTVLLNGEVPGLEQELLSLGVRVLLPTPDSLSNAESGIVSARYHARSVLREALNGKQISYDVVITQGLELSRYVAGGKSIQPAHWAIMDDDPLAPGNPRDLSLKSVRTIAEGARLLLFSSPESRSFVESHVPSATSKTRLLDPVPLNLPVNTTGAKVFVFDYNNYRAKWGSHSFDTLLQEVRFIRRPPQIIVIDDESEHVNWHHDLQDYPGVRFVSARQWAPQDYTNVHVVPVGFSEDDQRRLTSTLRSSDAILKLNNNEVSLDTLNEPATSSGTQPPLDFRSAFGADLPDYKRNAPALDHPVRVLLAGADFKFAGDLVDSLIQRSDIALNVDLFEANAKVQPGKSRPLLQSADVIIAEFAAKNAIWYSQNVHANQHLIVHLHGYELLQDWITELNVDNCSAIVFASEFYRQKAIEMRGWPEEKLVVIPNSVNFGDLARRKSPHARFHIGLVGIVPILKRPDRAIDLFEKLLSHDDRYTLHIRGHSPWNYGWEWKKSAHQDSYRKFYKRIGSNPNLRHRVVFEPFSPDIANWLQDIGWILSPSTRETFHLSAIEGAASGAVPIAWRREGSDEIIGEQFNFDSTEDAASFITNASTELEFSRLSTEAQNYAMKYSSAEVRAKWLDLIFSVGRFDSATNSQFSEADRILRTVAGAWHDNDPETAISVLDEHIPLTRDHRGPLKDAEMFFRGIAAADEKRFTQFLPIHRRGAEENSRIAMVRPKGSTFDEAELSPDIQTYVGVIPSAFIQSDGFAPVSESSVSLEAPNDVQIEVGGFIRLDRWFEMVKAQLMPVALSHSELAVQGPWWVALPVVQAADQAGIPSTWFIDDEQTLEWIAAASHGALRTHFAAQIAWNCFQASDVRAIFASHNIPNSLDIGTIDCSVGESPLGIPQWVPTRAGAPHYRDKHVQRTNAPTVLLRDLADTRIGLIADRSFSKDCSQHAQVVDLTTDNYIKQLDATFDLTVVHPSANASGPWKKKLEQTNESAQCEVTKLFDRARLLGATTCFVWDSPDPLPMRFWAVARKADAVLVTYPSTLSSFLQLNPSAVRAIGWWDANLPLATRLQVALRGVYQPVTLDRVHSKFEDTDDRYTENALSSEDLASSELPELERIAVFSNFPVEVWATQTLPAQLFDVLPRSQLGNKSDLNADYFVVYDSDKEPGDDFLLSLWLDADQSTIVVPNGVEMDSPTTDTSELALNCLYPMNCDATVYHVRQANAL